MSASPVKKTRDVPFKGVLWPFRVLLKGGTLSYLIPYPGLEIWDRWISKREKPRESNWALTVAIGVTIWFGFKPSLRVHFVGMSGDLLAIMAGLAAAITGLVVLSVGLPGSLLEQTVKRSMKAPLYYIAPYLWAFLWTLVGAAVLAFSGMPPMEGSLQDALNWAGTFVVAFAFLSAVDAFLATLRVFGTGLWAAPLLEQAKKEKEEAEGARRS